MAGSNWSTGERIHADLIVDAGGRNSKTAARLEATGFPKVATSEVAVDVGYATALLELPEDARPWKSLLVHPKYPDARLGVLLPIEGTGKWLATLVGWRGDHPPDDVEGFMAFAKSLAVPDFYAAIEMRGRWSGFGDTVSPAIYAGTSSRWTRPPRVSSLSATRRRLSIRSMRRG